MIEAIVHIAVGAILLLVAIPFALWRRLWGWAVVGLVVGVFFVLDGHHAYISQTVAARVRAQTPRELSDGAH